MQRVLVWQKNPAPPVIHARADCPSLKARSVVPGESQQFRGPGTAGWLRLDQAMELPHARKCQKCW
jgi:hypothetical protein